MVLRLAMGGSTKVIKMIKADIRNYSITCPIRWTDVWDGERVKNEAGFTRSVWHRTMAVNTWRAKVSRNPIDTSYQVSNYGVEESYMH